MAKNNDSGIIVPEGYEAGSGPQVCAIASDSVNVPDVIGMAVAPFSEYVRIAVFHRFPPQRPWNPVKTIHHGVFAICVTPNHSIK
jgi:hypothetical protein